MFVELLSPDEAGLIYIDLRKFLEVTVQGYKFKSDRRECTLFKRGPD